MIIFLYGKDNFRSYQKLKEIIDKYQAKYPEALDFHQLDLTDFENMEIGSLMGPASLFQEKKLIILRNAFALKKDEQKKLTNYLKNKKVEKDEDNILVFFEKNEVDQRTGLFKYLKKHSRSQKFSPLNKAYLKKWTKKIIKENFPELNLPDYLIDFLIRNLNADLWRIYHELEKMNSYQKNQSKKITKDNIKQLVVFPVHSDIFKTIDALALKNKKAALRSLAAHFKNLEPELKILAMFEYQFRSLVRVKALINKNFSYPDIQKRTKIHPYAFRKIYQLTRNFTMDELIKIYDKLFELDIGFKTGKIKDKKIALEMFVVELCQEK